MTQQDLFVVYRVGEYSNIIPADLPVFAKDSKTSYMAAKLIKGKTNAVRESVYQFIRAQGVRGATRPEIEQGLNMAGNTVRPRVKELLGEMPGFHLNRRLKRIGTRKNGNMSYEVLGVVENNLK